VVQNKKKRKTLFAHLLRMFLPLHATVFVAVGVGHLGLRSTLRAASMALKNARMSLFFNLGA
jgi:hypothetical protein